MPNKEEKTEFHIGIRRIKDIFFCVKENLFIPDSTKEIKIEIQQELGFNLDKDWVFFTLRVYFHYAESIKDENLVEIKVQNIFELKELKEFERSENLIELPPSIVLTIVSISIAHTRALLAKNTAGTVFQDTLFPILNVAELTKNLFPHIKLEKPIES